MKTTKISLVLALAAGIAFTACDDNFERPPMIAPAELDIECTTTIQDIKTEYWSAVSGTPVEIGTNADGDSLWLRGRICSSDASGNIYKSLIIQSINEDGEQYALTFAISNSSLSDSYKYGQEIFVNMTGLTVGGYGGLMQVGAASSSSMTFMDDAVFTANAQVSGLPRLAEIDTTATTLTTLAEAKANAETLRMWQSRLVRIQGVSFAEQGVALAGTTTTNRYVKDSTGTQLPIRTSSYADFKNELTPAGEGDVVGILSYYGSDWQLLLIDIDGLIGFTPADPAEETPETPATPDTPTDPAAVEIYSSLSSTATEMPDGWTIENVEIGSLSAVWSWKVYNNAGYLNASGYTSSGNIATEAYAISPVIDLTGATGCTATFEHAAKFQTTLKTLCGVVVRLEGSTDWTAVGIPTWPEAGAWTFVSAGNLDLSAFDGKKIQLAFKYGSSSSGADTWEIKNLVISGKK